MLGKLTKYEFKATARYLLPIYLVLLIITIIHRIVLGLDVYTGVFGFIPAILQLIYVILLTITAAVTFFIMITRFYKNLLGDEGYLMFTLPVKTHQLVLSKLIITLLWTALSLVVIFGSLYIVYITPENQNEVWKSFKEAFQELNSYYHGNIAVMYIELIILFILSAIFNVLLIYASIAIGQLVTGHKLVGSFIAYIALYTVLQFATVILLLIGGLIFGNDLDNIEYIPIMLLPVLIVGISAINILLYAVTNYFLKKRLNLD